MYRNGTKKNSAGLRQKWKCPGCGSQPTLPADALIEIDDKPITGGISEEQLRMKLDNRYILKKACEELARGTFYKNSEFVLKAGIKAGTAYRDIIEHPDFENFRGKNSGEIYWGHPESILKLKQEGILR